MLPDAAIDPNRIPWTSAIINLLLVLSIEIELMEEVIWQVLDQAGGSDACIGR
jgi:hypothetical protein